MSGLSRREFVARTTAGAVGVPFAVGSDGCATAAVTAQGIVDRIKKNVGVEWKAETVDTFKAGDPSSLATGIVTSALATMDVLRRAVKQRANLVITCEPTFFARADTSSPPAGRGAPGGAATPGAADPVFAAKAEFIRTHGLIVFRFSDHWRLRQPNPLAQGLVDALGWSSAAKEPPDRVTVPEISLQRLAEHVQGRLQARGGIRVIGDRAAKVRRVALLPGTSALRASLDALPEVDVVIAGEVREWESAEYARDTVAAGRAKGLVLVGRVVSEDPGMNVCARWLRTLVPEVATTWLPAGDPYWRPV